jgi:hypothetical protein
MTLGLANNIGRTAPKPIPTVAAELIQRKWPRQGISFVSSKILT